MGLRLCCLAVFAFSVAQPQTQPTATPDFTLESVLKDPLQDFAWSPDGKRLARFIKSAGQNEKRVALQLFSTESPQPGSTETMALPPTTTDLQWFPNGSALLLSSPTWLSSFELKTRRTQVLLSGSETISDPKISPDGRWISFIKAHNLWILDPLTGHAAALTKAGANRLHLGEPDRLYRDSFSLHSAYWWAPDSSKLALLEFDDTHVPDWPAPVRPKHDARPDHDPYPLPGGSIPVVHAAVIRLSDRNIQVIDSGFASDTYLPCVNWLPDSGRLALQVVDRKQKKLSLLFADVSNSGIKTVLEETDAYWMNVHDDLRFLPGQDQFIWSSERTGYRHLYLYNLEGQLVRPLTRGDWDVTQINAIDKAKRLIYFTSTAKSPLERHLSRITFDGSPAEQITKSAGWHTALFTADARIFIDSYSSATTPPVQALMHADGGPIRSALDEEKQVGKPLLFSNREFVSVKTHDGVQLNAMLLKPAGFQPQHKYPAIIFIDSRPETQIVRNAWGGSASAWNQQLAQQGFVVFALDTRGSGGRGHLFEEPIHCRLGAQELSDLLDGVAYLHGLPYIDRERIGIWGSGYGGQMVLHAMFEDTQDFKAGFADAPVADWQLYSAAFSERYLEVPKGFSGQFEESSPINGASHLRGNLLVSANPDDDVQYANFTALQNDFQKAGKHPELLLSRDPRAVSQRALEFFRQSLGGR